VKLDGVVPLFMTKIWEDKMVITKEVPKPAPKPDDPERKQREPDPPPKS
jgi:hypothetical protein